ncbi:hypothetical protein V9T40_001161 [Parthenolecanium corni]|uniref:DNA-directed DNA polymerase n=1 Tax=Parthenolecanium corni TaxID=536013 RepID=A0AAN9TAX2_9HEMI
MEVDPEMPTRPDLADLSNEASTSNDKRPTEASSSAPKRVRMQRRFNFEEVPSSALEEEDELRYTEVQEVGQRTSHRFGLYEKVYKLAFKKEIAENPPRDWDWMTSAINGMRKYAEHRMQFQSGDKMNIMVDNRNFNHPISTGYNWSEDTVANLVNKIRDIITSDTKVLLKECQFHVTVVKIPRGRGRTKVINLKEDRRTKHCIIRIQNTDDLCCPRAIVTGMVLKTDIIAGTKLEPLEVQYVKEGRNKQRDMAIKICEMAGLSPTARKGAGFTIEDIHIFEEALDIQVKVIDARSFNSVVYKGWAEKPIKVFLYMDGDHFDVITRMNTFFGAAYYCQECDAAYNTKQRHNCMTYQARKKKSKKLQDEPCPLCLGDAHASDTTNPIYCNNCNRWCYNNACKTAHDTKVCPAAIKCQGCCKILSRDRVQFHKCGWEWCRNCKKLVQANLHECYMQRKQAKGGICYHPKCSKCKEDTGTDFECPKCTYTEKYIFFDYEAQQETGVHIPNLCVAQDFEGNRWRFPDNDSFCSWLISREHKGYTAIAHYARGYDSQFILQYMYANSILPKTVPIGTKLLSVEVQHLRLRIIDSHSFMQSPLSALPKMFGLTELKKGYFPHLFNTAENAGYVGPMPPAECYSPDRMKSDARATFLKWYEDRLAENYVFDMDRELEEYCDSDVDILRRSCLELRRQFLDVANIDPFQYLTIPSVCMAIYRSKYLPLNTIAVLPLKHDSYSKQAMAWLYSLQNDSIKHALNGGEQIICGAPVDGYDPVIRVIYQFHGCYWHGCPRCFEDASINKPKKDTMLNLRLRTQHRTLDLRNAGYTVIEMWGCDWKKTRNRMQWEEYASKRCVTPLKPRDAFYGGRTEVFKLKVPSLPLVPAVEEDEELVVEENAKTMFADQCSMYPGAMYFNNYPIGHPTAIFSPTQYDYSWYGVIHCRLLPPSDLYLPVLPARVKMGVAEKLLFPLCNTCAKHGSQECAHQDQDRSIEGTWATIEVEAAMRRGYKIQSINEVWHFKKSGDLWRGYVRDFLKLKLESTPHTYPTHEAYALEIRTKLGIELDVNEIKPNPGKRALAKLCLNSLWGKFGQRTNQAQDEFVKDPWRFYEILRDDTLTDINVLYVSEEMLQVSYRKIDHFIENIYNTNIMIAIFTTAHGRLALYEAMEKIGRNMIYCDTDSVIYSIPNGQENPIEYGELLGEWTNELSGDDYINKWLATGPKSYHFQTRDGKKVTKVKGFTLHHKNSQVINAETMERLIDGDIHSVAVQDFQIICDKTTRQLTSRTDKPKTLRFNFDKRVIIDNYDTLPYGYRSL